MVCTLTSSVAKSYVDKIMTTVNQCCFGGLTFYHLDPSLNKQAQKQKAKEATEERAGFVPCTLFVLHIPILQFAAQFPARRRTKLQKGVPN
jgi:hypothetical protein